jgi:anti-anti-sigma factor
MQVSCRADSDHATCLLAKVSGKLDTLGATELWDAISPELNEIQRHLVIDLSGVDLLTSSGVGTLIRIRHRLQRFGGGVAVTGCSPRVLEVIRIVMLEEILMVSATPTEARARLGAA